jgi:hypothetical protein
MKNYKFYYYRDGQLMSITIRNQRNRVNAQAAFGAAMARKKYSGVHWVKMVEMEPKKQVYEY